MYEITSKASFDLVVSARQKIALRNKDVSADWKGIEIQYPTIHTTLLISMLLFSSYTYCEC